MCHFTVLGYQFYQLKLKLLLCMQIESGRMLPHVRPTCRFYFITPVLVCISQNPN